MDFLLVWCILLYDLLLCIFFSIPRLKHKCRSENKYLWRFYSFVFPFLLMMNDSDFLVVDDWWKQFLANEFAKPYFVHIQEFLLQEQKSGHTIYPQWSDIFNAFNLTPFEKIKVVIIWQDPYHGEWQAHGLCFSVQDWIKLPPSLKNIFKELNTNLWIPMSSRWNLTQRAKQWVFLLNASLTVQKDSPNSHKNIGWHTFTDAVIKIISDKKDGVIFLLWWAFAQNKKHLIDTTRHFVLECPHPSPFSAYTWFFGSKHFSKTNEILKSRWEKEIDWSIT